METLRRYVSQAPSDMAMFDPDMRYIAVSRGWIATYGLAGDFSVLQTPGGGVTVEARMPMERGARTRLP